MNNKNTFGEVFFSELQNDSYLHEIYDNILYNYALHVFGFNKNRRIVIPIVDALSFADLLSKSNHSIYAEEQKVWAQEIITMLYYLNPSDSRIAYMTGAVLSNLGNYQGQEILRSSYEGIDTLDRLFSEFKKEYLTIPADPTKYFMVSQRRIYDHFQDSYLSYSGPTSMGKSYIMRMFIKHRLMQGIRDNFAIIVPTKALINEVQIKLTEDLGESLHENDYRIITAAGDAALKLEDERRKYIYVMTPERLLYLLINERNVKLEYLFIDEAQKISKRDNRSAFYYQIVQLLSELTPRPKIIFASPNVPNPQLYLETIQDIDHEKDLEHIIASKFSPVTQIKFLINLETHETSVYNEHTKSLIPFTSVALKDADLIDVLLRFRKNRDGKDSPFIVYFSSVKKTIEAARDYAANLPATSCIELQQLSKDIRNEVHDDYYLADLISVGVAYHIGYLPTSIRQRIEELFHEGVITALFCTSTLVEGVNFPADNLFVTDYRNGRTGLSTIEFRNLIGRVGRLGHSLSGNVFLVAQNTKTSEHYTARLQERINDEALSIEKGLTKPDKLHVIKTLLTGNVAIEKSKASQSDEEYNLMRSFEIMLLNDILKNRDSRIHREFSSLMKSGDEEQIREMFSGKASQIDDDITISIDQSETLYEAISSQELEFPKIIDGKVNKSELDCFLEWLCQIFKWEQYESKTLGHVNERTGRHSLLSWYEVTLMQWVQGEGLSTIIYHAINYKRLHPEKAIFIDGQYYDYQDTKEHKNIVISDVLSVIDKIILFKLSNYFLKVSKAYKEIKNVDRVPNDWYEYVEYGSTNERAILLQKHGFSRESALYIIRKESEFVVSYFPELKIKSSIFECTSKSVLNDIDFIRYNIPEIFVE